MWRHWLIFFQNLDFDENALRAVIDQISEQSGELLEIVNFNLEDEQYVCAGHVSAHPIPPPLSQSQ